MRFEQNKVAIFGSAEASETGVLEMARRAISWPLPTVAVIALLYGVYGEWIPGEFGHPGLPLNSFLGTLTITEGGIWGKLTLSLIHI